MSRQRGRAQVLYQIRSHSFLLSLLRWGQPHRVPRSTPRVTSGKSEAASLIAVPPAIPLGPGQRCCSCLYCQQPSKLGLLLVQLTGQWFINNHGSAPACFILACFLAPQNWVTQRHWRMWNWEEKTGASGTSGLGIWEKKTPRKLCSSMGYYFSFAFLMQSPRCRKSSAISSTYNKFPLSFYKLHYN